MYNTTAMLFIGANNQTKQIDYHSLWLTLDLYSKGWNMQGEGIGSWIGDHEKSVVVFISGLSEGKLQSLIRDLKRVLEQDSIGVIMLPAMQFI